MTRRRANNVNCGGVVRVNVPLSEEIFEAFAILAARNGRTVAQQIRYTLDPDHDPFTKNSLDYDLRLVAKQRIAKRKESKP